MILENFINFETPVDNELIEVDHFHDADRLNKKLKDNRGRLFIIVNLGNIIDLNCDGRTQLCPPKNCFLGIKDDVRIIVNPNHHFKGTLLICRDSFRDMLLEKIRLSIEKKYVHIFNCRDFLFDFPLSINMISIFESLYKAQINKTCFFHLLEIETLVVQLFIQMLRVIINLDQKYAEQFTTLDTKYYIILKTFFDHPVTIEDTLKLYNMEKEHFKHMFERKNPSLDFETYLTEEKKNSSIFSPIDIDLEDIIEEAPSAE